MNYYFDMKNEYKHTWIDIREKVSQKCNIDITIMYSIFYNVPIFRKNFYFKNRNVTHFHK